MNVITTLWVSETFLSGYTPHDAINLAGHCIEIRGRDNHVGGVAIYYMDSLDVTRRNDLENGNEVLWVLLVGNNKRVLKKIRRHNDAG